MVMVIARVRVRVRVRGAWHHPDTTMIAPSLTLAMNIIITLGFRRDRLSGDNSAHGESRLSSPYSCPTSCPKATQGPDTCPEPR